MTRQIVKTTLFSVIALALLLGCATAPPKPSSSIDQFENFHTRTDWKISQPTGIPEDLPGWKIERPGNGRKVHLTSPRGVAISYEEFSPSFMHFPATKTASEPSRLKSIAGIDKPVFEVNQPSSNSDHVVLAGFAGNRKFVLTAKVAESRTYTSDVNGLHLHVRRDRALSFDEAASLAVDVYNRIKR